MDRKFNPIVRKILIDKIHIPFYKNSPNEVLLEFIKNLWKFRCILQSLFEKIKGIDLDRLYDSSIQIDTFPTPNKRRK
jgi:hypothetical protein